MYIQMDRPRSFVIPSESFRTSYERPIASANNANNNFFNIDTPFRSSALTFVVVFLTLGVSPDIWPFSRYYRITTPDGSQSVNRRLVIALVVATLVYYAKHYVKM